MRVNLKKLNPKEKRRRGRKFLVLDIETKENLEDGPSDKFLCVGIYDGLNFHYFDDLSVCLRYLFAEYPGFDVFAHYGGRFDLLFILQSGLNEGYEIGEIIPRGSSILTFSMSFDDARISFRDSTALLPFSLRSLSENFGLTYGKKEINYREIKKITPELIEYLEYDCRGLYEALEKFYDWPIVKRAGRSNTIAGQAMRVLRTYLLTDISYLSKQVDDLIRPAYQGGRTEIFRPLFQSKGEKIYCYDVNSLYPRVMRDNEFPNRFKYRTYKYEENALGFYHCKVTLPTGLFIPPLGIVREGKFIFPSGNFYYFGTVAEINYARSLGVRIETGTGYIFSSAGFLFKSFVEALWKIRSKAEKNSVDNVLGKLIPNSCYGRFGINPDNKEVIVLEDGQLPFKPLGNQWENIGVYRGKNFVELGTRPKDLETFSNVAIAAYVTSYARIYMHRILSSVEGSLYYTDTDSVFTTERMQCGSGLGELKLEYESDSACFLLPKTYFVSGKKEGKEPVNMKGFPRKKIQHFSFEDFKSALEGDLKRLKIVQGPRFATLKQSARNKTFVSLTKQTSRQINAIYDKRKIIKKNGQYTTIPIHLGE